MFTKNIFWDWEDFRIIFFLKSFAATCPNLLRKKKFSYGLKKKLLGNWFALKEGGG